MVNYSLDKLLIEIGIMPHKKGYDYVKELICLTFDYNETKLKPLYEKMAQKHGVSSNSINRCIFQAIESAYLSGKLNKLNKRLEVEVCDDKRSLTNSEFVFLVSKYLKGAIK